MSTSADIKVAAAELLKREIVSERLKGDERGFQRWQSNNSSYWNYRLRLKLAELNGTVASVQAADAEIVRARAAQMWRKNANGTLTSPTGQVMTLEKARRNGYEG